MGEKKPKKIKIGQYKGYTIYYFDEEFIAEHKNKMMDWAEKTEEGLKERIRYQIDLETQRKEEEAKERMMKKNLESLKKINITFDFEQLYDIIKQAKGYLTELPLVFNKGVMSFSMMDPANVCMIHRKIKYKGKLNGFQVTLDVKSFNKVLIKLKKNFKPKTIDVGFYKEELPYSNLYMLIKNGFGCLSVIALDSDERNQKLPKLTFLTEFTIPRQELVSYIQMAKIANETLYFEIKDNYFRIEAVGDNGQRFVKEKIKKVNSPDCKTKYSIGYLKDNFAIGEEIKVMFGNDYPLKIEDDTGCFILAPRVDGD